MGHDAGDLQAVVVQSELELCKLGELHGRIENMVSACACVMNAKKSMMNLYCRTGQQLNGRLTDELAVDWTGLSCLWTLLSIVQLSTPESAAAAAAGPFNDNNQLPNELMCLSWRHDSHNF